LDASLTQAIKTLRRSVTPIAVLLSAGILLLDLFSRLPVDFEILYLIPLLLLLRSPNKGAAMALAAAFSFLIFLGGAVSPLGSPSPLGWSVRLLLMGIIWAATLLVLRVKRAEERLHQARKEQQVIFDSVPAMIWYKDKHNRILRANRTAANSIGKPVAELEGQYVHDLYPVEDATKYHQDDLEVIQSGQPKLGIVEPLLTASGAKRWIRTDKMPYRDEQGRVIGVLVFSMDITDSEQLAALEASMDGMAIVNGAGAYAYVNEAFARQYGFTHPQELLGRAWRMLYDPQELGRFDRQVLPLLASQGHWRGEALGRRRDGLAYPQELSLTRLQGGELICVVRDITERKRAEEALRTSEEHLRQSQRMEAVGRLAGGIAHEFNNLLTVVMGHSHLLLTRLADDNPMRNQVLQIQEAGRRATELTHQLLAFSRKQVLQPTALDLNVTIHATHAILRPMLSEAIELAMELQPGAGWIKADRGQIQQVILNLAMNARDAMPQGGRLTISTAGVQGQGQAPAGSRPAGKYALLRMADTGMGMDDHTREHCFDPFFTTKDRGKGTGLGLATVYGIVSQSGGFIEVASAPGRGSTFDIYLPQVDPPAGAAAGDIGAAGDAQGSETILLVEDEVLVRNVARGALESLGYTVLEAANGQEALQVSQDCAGPIHLLLTDVIMPGLNGRELAEKVRASRPQLRVIFMSGYTADVASQQDGFQDLGAFLVKPFDQATLGRKVRDVLDTGP
jgi:two-component system, cell cycle sensor histidine kinase and response regulator CckA